MRLWWVLFSGVHVTNYLITLNHVDVGRVDGGCQDFNQNILCTYGWQIYIFQPGNQKNFMSAFGVFGALE